MDREAGQAIVHVVARSWTRLSNFHFQFLFIQTYEGILKSFPIPRMSWSSLTSSFPNSKLPECNWAIFSPSLHWREGGSRVQSPESHQLLYLNFCNAPHRYEFFNSIFKTNLFDQKRRGGHVRKAVHWWGCIPPGILGFCYQSSYNWPILCHTVKHWEPERSDSLSWKDLCSASSLGQPEIQPAEHPYRIIAFLVNQQARVSGAGE